jgi:hypothetical protein
MSPPGVATVTPQHQLAVHADGPTLRVVTQEARAERAERAAEAARRKPWQERMKEASALYAGSRPQCWPATDMRSLLGAPHARGATQ